MDLLAFCKVSWTLQGTVNSAGHVNQHLFSSPYAVAQHTRIQEAMPVHAGM